MSKLITRRWQNGNTKSSAYQKYYQRVLLTETLTTNEFAAHIASHGSPYTRDIIQGVLMAACDCLVELCLDSKAVRLSDLGIFKMAVHAEGATKADDATADKVQRVQLQFLPNQTKAYNLSSKALSKKASVIGVDQLSDSVTDGYGQSGSSNSNSANGNPTDGNETENGNQNTGGDNTSGGGGFQGNPEDDTQSGGSGNDPSTGSGQGNENQNGNSGGGTTSSVAAPVISDDANITANGTVHVTCATDGASMYYTVGMDSDPADPTNQSTAVPANGTIVANESYSEDAHLKVIAYKDGVYSTVASKTIPARQDD